MVQVNIQLSHEAKPAGHEHRHSSVHLTSPPGRLHGLKSKEQSHPCMDLHLNHEFMG